MPSHYDVLGVGRDADAATIRAAYRRLARRHHPDQRGGAGDDEMAAINEAYRVLGDPGRRAVYDRSGSEAPRAAASAATPRPTTTEPPRPADLAPARIPWKLMGGIVAFGTAAVLLGAVFTDPGEEPGPDGLLRTGSCVEIEPNGDAREVRCAGAGDIVVHVLVPIDAECPGGTEPHRDRQGLGTACVVRPAG